MKQSLNLRLGQQLTMTPQLQQAIKLLQMSTLDLQQEIQQVLESNIMLEISEDENNSNDDFSSIPDHKSENTDSFTSEGSQTDIPDELPTDYSWDDVYENTSASGSSGAEPVEFESQRTNAPSLQDHLLWQMELTHFSERDHAIAIAIIDSTNEDGYLITSPDDIYEGLKNQFDDLDFDEVNAVLHRVQQFDPTGIAAIDLADCLRLQLLQLPPSTPYKEEALIVVTQHLKLLASQEQAKLLKKLDVTEQQLTKIVALIRSLDPKPGAKIQESESEYVIPDVYVSKRNNQWQVNLNPDIAPKLRINPFYSNLIKNGFIFDFILCSSAFTEYN